MPMKPFHWNESEFWRGFNKETKKFVQRESELRRSDVVVLYKRSGSFENDFSFPRLSMNEILGTAILARVLMNESDNLFFFGLKLLEGLQDYVTKKFNLETSLVDESMEDFLIDFDLICDPSGQFWKSYLADHYASYGEGGKSSQFFGNMLKPAMRKFDSIRIKELQKVRRPQRRKGYNDKGSTRPQHNRRQQSCFSFEDDQRHTYHRRKQLIEHFSIYSALLGADTGGRSSDFTFTKLNFKNPDREDDLYVTKSKRYRIKRKKHSGRITFEGSIKPGTQQGTTAKTYAEKREPGVGYCPAKQQNYEPGAPIQRSSPEIRKRKSLGIWS